MSCCWLGALWVGLLEEDAFCRRSGSRCVSSEPIREICRTQYAERRLLSSLSNRMDVAPAGFKHTSSKRSNCVCASAGHLVEIVVWLQYDPIVYSSEVSPLPVGQAGPRRAETGRDYRLQSECRYSINQLETGSIHTRDRWQRKAGCLTSKDQNCNLITCSMCTHKSVASQQKKGSTLMER